MMLDLIICINIGIHTCNIHISVSGNVAVNHFFLGGGANH